MHLQQVLCTSPSRRFVANSAGIASHKIVDTMPPSHMIACRVTVDFSSHWNCLRVSDCCGSFSVDFEYSQGAKDKKTNEMGEIR